ncbi:hypothetical protein B1150_14080, partial [Enterococcus faecium]|uniref:hypothetical protein n=1 Tax=Enterococcus faecium TaxID=1352 RepID=UPI000DEB2169
MVLNNFLKEGFILSYLIVCLIIIICLHHLFLSKTIPRYSKNKKAEKFCLLLNKFTLIAPILAFIIFSVLLSTTLKGKFMERSSHAMILTFLWLLFTRIYIFLMSLKPPKSISLCLVINGIFLLSLIIFITPLDRYVTDLYNPL